MKLANNINQTHLENPQVTSICLNFVVFRSQISIVLMNAKGCRPFSICNECQNIRYGLRYLKKNK